jgi:hypothetical protein
VDDEHSGFDVAFLCRHRGLQVAMKADHSVEIGAAARQLKHVAATETKPDRCFLAAVANAALIGFSHHRGQSCIDPLATFHGIGLNRHHPLLRGRRPFTGFLRRTYTRRRPRICRRPSSARA